MVSKANASDKSDLIVYCKQITSLTGNTDPQVIQTCIKEEMEARAALEQQDIPQSILDHCDEVASIGQMNTLGDSHTLVKMCVDQELENMARYEALRTGQPMPEKKSAFMELLDWLP